ncbi:DUF4397 domain-containing protein [Caldimonas brevitalea]|uniref:DUF4397 domain-containing protein n=1 Tax=Caldimonas brevitalea TaxID=413882 RepID=A0A0G3BYP6_9BURK|nr:DUF4397 domain-containing protein [Caldimonas brevitalea]AKJ31650.1 hypothetical protein AAW51_4959 [Caldimonas brevitalea]
MSEPNRHLPHHGPHHPPHEGAQRPDGGRRTLLAALAAAALAPLAACGGGGDDHHHDDDDAGHEQLPLLRFVNATLEYASLDVFLPDIPDRPASKPVEIDLRNGGTTTPYDSLGAKRHRVRMKSTTFGVEGEVEGEKVFEPDTYTTALAYGGRGTSGKLVFLDENEPAAPDGRHKLRVLHASPLHQALDVYVTPPTMTDLRDEPPALAGIAYGAVTAYKALAVGLLRVHVTAAGSKTVLYRSDPFHPSGSITTLALLPRNDRLHLTELPQGRSAQQHDNVVT